MPANNAKLKHTAPPWELKMLTGMRAAQAVIQPLPGGLDRYICLFLRTGGINEEEAMGNARLIARAPDLLRCLDQLNDSLYKVEGDSEGVWRINQSAVEGLTELLNELRGEAETMKPEGHDSAS